MRDPKRSLLLLLFNSGEPTERMPLSSFMFSVGSSFVFNRDPKMLETNNKMISEVIKAIKNFTYVVICENHHAPFLKKLSANYLVVEDGYDLITLSMLEKYEIVLWFFVEPPRVETYNNLRLNVISILFKYCKMTCTKNCPRLRCVR